ncbi:MAG: 50S ribosomal protein L18e [Candidatus Diapherotrites archaeon]|nr:50S ribosomal protein L18e [Candidatus Diapherotrites archaeon]
MVKVTGPTKERTKKLIAALEKAGRKTKKAIWFDLAERLGKPARQQPDVNIWKLEKLAKIFPGKTLLVPGKVLSYGHMGNKATIIGFSFSAEAKRKISAAGGVAMSIEEALQKKAEPGKIVIVK